MRSKITILSLVALILGCTSDLQYYNLPDYEIFQYEVGDYLIYRSNLNHIDTLIVFYKYLDYWGDNAFGGPSIEFYEHHVVALYFPRDEDSIRFDKSWASDFRIQFSGSVDPIDPAKYLLWKQHLRFDLEDKEVSHSIMVYGKHYDNVYILNPQDDINDSLTLVREIYFNYKSGILKYEHTDGEVFEFIGKL